MNNISTFKSCFNAGDLLGFMPCVKQNYIDTGKKGVLYLWVNKPIRYTNTSVHPIQNDKGETVSMNEQILNFLKPFLLEQEYIQDILIWDGEEVDFDFDKLQERFAITPFGSLNRWMFYIYSKLSYDLSESWFNVNAKQLSSNKKILITRTDRYLNHFLSFFFLRKFQSEIVFIGLPEEREKFCKDYKLEIEYYEVETALQLAIMMKYCRFFMGNQTMLFQLAEGLKIPRILERSPELPNVVPIGKYAYDVHNQENLEERFQYLYNKTKTT